VTRPIRRVGFGVILLFVALAGQLSYLQLVRAEKLENDPRNVRNFLRDINRERGPVVTADGEVVAFSEPLTRGGDFRFQRRYPLGDRFAHVSGYQSVVFGNTGVENSYNDELIGRTIELVLQPRNILDQLGRGNVTGTLVLSLSRSAQDAAAAGLAGRDGSVVVLDVRSGAVVAMYSNPTYDPNLLAGHTVDDVVAIRRVFDNSPKNPELARAYREVYPPGSTFKVVTAAIALDAGLFTPDSTFPSIDELTLPLTTETLENFGGATCGGTLFESFVVSCNTTFGAVGLGLGETFAEGLERFGINTPPPPLDLRPGAVRSIGPQPGTFRQEQPLFAQAAIGQGAIAVTPLEMALVAQAVANGGVMMVPHVGAQIRDPDGRVIDRIAPGEWRRAMSPQTSAILTEMMRAVVERGTGTAAQIPGVPVAGKTGTAQVPGRDPHAWFIGFAPADNPVYAIAVLVENGGDLGSEATGGRVAAPIARDVLTTLLGAGG
jgi:peptidoglycan glycosyltransferase